MNSILVITPPVGGARRFDPIKNVVRLLLFVLAAIVSAAAVGVICSYFGALFIDNTSVLSTVLWISVCCCSAVYGLAELSGARWWVPSRDWLIPRHWGRWGSPVFDILFGLFLGAGFFTIIRFIGYPLLLIICVLNRDPLKGAMLMGTFGAARSIPILLLPLTHSVKNHPYDIAAAYEMHKYFIRGDRNLRAVRATVLLAVAGVAVAVASAFVKITG